MKVVVGNEKEISQMIADEFIKVVKNKPNAVLGLATGTSPLLVYADMAKAYKDGEVSFKDCKSVLLGVGDYKAYMNQYDKEIDEAGGIDIQILGIGSDGHIAFNEPGTPFDSLTHETELTEQTIKDNSRLFNDISEVPTRAVTMGLASIMKAKKIVLIATGKNKAKAVYGLIKGEMTEDMPCSILQKHPDCTVYVDEEAYSLVK